MLNRLWDIFRNTGKMKKLIIAGSLFVILSMLVVILHLVPGKTVKQTQPVKIAPVVKPLIKVEKQVKRGDTILTILQAEGIDQQRAYRFFQEVRPLYDLKNLRTGQKYTLFFSGKMLEKFVYEIDIDRYLEVQEDEAGHFTGKLITFPFQMCREFVRGRIRFSLFESILESGERPELADILAALYEYDIDFNRDIREGDTFAIYVEKKYLEGKFVRYGDVVAAEFVNRGEKIQVLRYSDPTGNTSYYHPDGRAVKKLFRRCPLPFMRVTSRYGSRLHPILNFTAQHNGVDFGAPAGTQVLASASGVVQQTGYTGSRGNFITIRHPNRYISHYLHLRQVKNGIKPGKRVEQNEIIGYVGSTGLSNGPHLHYGLQKEGRYINPLSLKSPSLDPVKKELMPDFIAYSRRLFLFMDGHKVISAFPVVPLRPFGLIRYWFK